MAHQWFSGSLTIPPANSPPDNIIDSALYDRGVLTFHALRMRVGDDAFFKILRSYIEHYTRSIVTTADFIAVAAPIAEMGLGGEGREKCWVCGSQ